MASIQLSMAESEWKRWEKIRIQTQTISQTEISRLESEKKGIN